MLLIRCTTKLRKDMCLKEAGLYDGETPSSPLDTWYANLLRVSRRKCVIFTHAESLFSFVTFDASKARMKNLDAIFREGLAAAMRHEAFDSSDISELLDRYETVHYAKTDSRSILASMNDIAINFDCYTFAGGGVDCFDLPATILRLNRVPLKSLGFKGPIEIFAGLLGVDRKVLLEKRIAAVGGTGAVYQLMITLIGSDPPIWRRLLVRDVTLGRLSDFLIAAMGWKDAHLHMFAVGGKHYSDPDPEWCDPELLDENTVELSDIASIKHRSFIYEYDMGDSWRHEVTIERVEQPEEGRRYLVCVAGALACPPEDVGGIGGFYEFLSAVLDPAHHEHDFMLTWAGGRFDPEHFDLEQTNRELMASVLKCGWHEII